VNTERLYYNDSYLTVFRARVAEIDANGSRVYLGHSAFYPTSGGQPHDTGTIGGVRVREVFEDESGRVAHVLEAPLHAGREDEVECVIDRERRFDHMQQHTGQHLLSAVLNEVAQAPTVSFHMSADVSTVDLAVASLDSAVLEQVERRCNEVVTENRPVSVTYEDASSARDLRKPSDREGLLRIVGIEGIDRSACGGTHLRSTGEIGCILLRGTEKVRGSLRLDFVCGLRAVRRARADYAALSAIGRTLSAAADDTPKLVEALAVRVGDAEKQRARLAVELATLRGREAYRECPPGRGGLRVRAVEVSSIGDEARAEAQAFAAQGQAAAIAWCARPASVLLACSPDSGLHAGNILKPLLTEREGRGGGSARVAQGGVPADAAELAEAIQVAIYSESAT
jgi:alanyl-tRNA synthetase